MSRGTIIVAGAIAQRPARGGHTWVFLQYLLGFKRLGWDVLFLDWLDDSMCSDSDGRPCRAEDSVNAKYLRDELAHFGLEHDFALLAVDRSVICGMRREDVVRRADEAALLINVMGYLADEEILERSGRRVFLDIDPGFPQMWYALGLHDAFAGHDDFVTVGLALGDPSCAVPTCGRKWITTLPPVVLDLWPQCEPVPDAKVTTVGSWRGVFGPIDYGGATYGLRVHEFRKFASLPRHVGQQFEVALDIGPEDRADIAALLDNDWAMVDPLVAASDPDAYRRYVQRSAAEFMVAKNMYVRSRCGWFSDRSACYLASGRPVLAQDTGFAGHLPANDGCVTFATLDEAASGVAEVMGDYGRHATAARDLAEAYFDSDVVLTRLLDNLSVA
jgi:hypothetical protein